MLAKYAKFDVTLDNSQHNEICKIVTELDNNHRDRLEAVYKEAGDCEGALRNIWIADKQWAEFYKGQAKNGLHCFVMKSYFVYRSWKMGKQVEPSYHSHW